MPNEFVARNGIIALANSIVTGSVTATQGFTGSLFGTSSWANNAATSSFILNAVSASFAATASSADNFLVRGTLTAQTIVAQVITSSTDFVTGSTRFGTLLTNTHVFSGSVTMNPGGLFVSGSGLVGIGTTSPALPLTIFNSNAATLYQTAGTGTGGGNGFYVGHTGNVSYVYNYNAFPLVLATNNTERMRIDSGGNIGIGTTSPTSKLEISSSATEAFRITGGTVNGLYSTFFNGTIAPLFLGFGGTLSATATNNDGVIRYNGSYNLIFTSDGTERMRLNSSGNVGINCTGANAKLEVVATSGEIFRADAASGAYRIVATQTGVNMNGNVGIGTTSPSTKLHVAGGTRMGGNLDLDSSSKITGNVFGNSGTEFTYITMYNSGDASINMGVKHPLSYISFEAGNGAYTERMRITNTGNVGIGTTAPAAKLDVSGDIFGRGVIFGYASSTQYGGLSYGLLGSTDGFLFLKTGGTTTVQLQASGSSYFNAGNVGIGTTTPSVKLQVVGDGLFNSNTNTNLTINSNGGTAALTLTNTAGSQVIYGGIGGLNVMDFYTNSTFRVRIDASGNVGIGTTSPGNLLSVAGNISLASAGFLGFTGATALTTSNYALYGSSINTYLNVATGGSIGLNIGNNSILTITGSNVGIGTTTPTARLHVSGTTGGVFEVDGAAAVNALYVSASGRIGIGNITPGYTLDVTGNIHTTTTMYIDASNAAYLRGGDDHEWWDINVANTVGLYGVSNSAVGAIKLGSGGPTLYGASGNLGIGTTSPAYRLDVQGGDINFSGALRFGGVVVIDNSSTDVYANIRVIRSRSTLNDGMYINYDSTGTTAAHLRFFANGTTERMRIDASSGNVGIGTTSPAAKLHVAGGDSVFGSSNLTRILGASQVIDFTNAAQDTYVAGRINGLNLKFYTNSGSGIDINSSGNVGIGTTSPGYKLDVSGSGRFNSTQIIGPDGTYGATYPMISFTGIANGSHRIFAGTSDDMYFAAATSRGFEFRPNGGTSSALNILSGGNVGIGTTSPSEKLSVIGNIDSTSTGTKIGFNVSDSFTAYGSSSAHYGMSYARDTNPLKLSGYFGVSVFTVGTEKLSIAQNGATTITSDSTEQVTIRTVTNTNRQLLIGYNYTPNYGYIQAVEQGTAFRNLLLNPSGGNVGIGTTSPSFKLDVNGTFRATTYTTGDYINYGFAISSPSANFGNARSYVRLHTTASGARIVSFKIRLSTTWSWVPGFGYIDADVSYYFDGTSLVYPSVNVTSATGQALNSIAIGDLVIENGYISVPVYITNSNSLFIKIEGSPNFDYSLITTTAWSSVTFPGSNTVKVPGALYVGSNVGIADTSPAARLSILEANTGVPGIKITNWNSVNTVSIGSDSATGGGKILLNTNGSVNNVFISSYGSSYFNGGNVGIGTTSPSFKLDVNGILGLSGFRFADKDGNYNRIFEPAGNVAMYLGNASDPGNYYDNTSHNFRTRGGGTFYMVINSSGNVGIGTTSPSYKLHLRETTSADCRLQIENTSTGNAGIEIVGGGGNQYIDFTPVASTDFEGRIIYSSSSDEMQFMTNITNRFKLNSNGAEVQNGALGVGVAANSTDGRIDASNDIVAYSSDKRLKTNIQSIENPLDKIGKLSGFTYNWNDKAAKLANYDTNESLIGVFAQEVQAVLPEAVKLAPFDNDGNNKSISGENYLTVQYEKIVPLLIEAIKEQQKQIDDLKYLLSQK
jgi:hypothetical protein